VVFLLASALRGYFQTDLEEEEQVDPHETSQRVSHFVSIVIRFSSIFVSFVHVIMFLCINRVKFLDIYELNISIKCMDFI
jgi:hypothetical protein